MKEVEYAEFLRSRGQTEPAIRAALGYVTEFKEYLEAQGSDLDSVAVHDVKDYASRLIAEKKNSMERFVALARYVYVTGLNEVYIYFTSILGGREVLPSISERLASIAGEATRDKVFEGIGRPVIVSQVTLVQQSHVVKRIFNPSVRSIKG